MPVINYIRRAPNPVHGDWILGSLLKALCEESDLFHGTDEWMPDADAYYVQPGWKVTRSIVNRSLVNLTSYRMDPKLAKLINRAPAILTHCGAQTAWLAAYGIRKPDAVISDGWQPHITVREGMPDKFTVGVFGHERVQSYLQTHEGKNLGAMLVKGTDRIPLIAEHLDPAAVAWHFGGPSWKECKAYHRLKEMGFEVTDAHYPAHEVASGYHKLDCLLVASRSETGPTVGLDALAAGLPVISTRVGQMSGLSDMLWDKEIEAAEHISSIQKDRDGFFGRRYSYRATVADRTRKQFAEKTVRLIHEKILDAGGSGGK